MRSAILGIVTMVAALLVLPGATTAQNVAEVYQLTPKAGQGPALESALKGHAQWREEHDDPWSWNVYQVALGEGYGTYVVRSAGHTWSDFDEYLEEFGSTAVPEFQAHVAPLVSESRTSLVRMDTALSRIPEDLSEYSIFSVTTYDLETGQGEDFYQVVEQVHEAAVEHDYPDHYFVYHIEYGAGASDARIVVPHTSWSDLEPPEETLGDVMTQAYGEEKAAEIFDDFTDTFRSAENMVVVARPDLSVNPPYGDTGNDR